ncbi:alpha/beta hydrolase [Micromonospora sp. WMMD975]|uniref:alpha/beta hydrolase family protein n=1 Tax=Micromonospora sp. WMMD975 TaxID=3016087 RepID=UPI00249A3D33|nr:alpha/beta hydrolase [Micromonospora sp. WMMD975]WFE31943.1 alpha/beta hydrolase [Micromonospora sp. WMMD975]
MRALRLVAALTATLRPVAALTATLRLVAALTAALLAGCGPAVATSDPIPAAVRPAPERPYPVGMRQFTVDPDGPRPLPVTVWYPVDPAASPRRPGPDRPAAAPSAGTEIGPNVWARAPVAAGRFPVVVYSHGLRSLPALHAPLTSRWAAAGLVVVAPTYPRTNKRARNFSRDDVRHQPTDAWRLVRHLIRLSTRADDPLGAHLAMDRLAAAGHSAGGHTALGMFASAPPVPLRAGIVIAGGRMVIGPARPLAPVLFVHGTADRIVPQSIGRAAYARCLGPVAFLSLLRQGHGEYLTPGRSGFAQVLATTTDFLRWTLYGDRAALRRLPADAAAPNTTRFTTRSFPT